MESYHTQIEKKHNLSTFGIFKESIKIPFQNPKFTALSVLASLPLFSATLLHELALRRALTPLRHAAASATPYDAVSLDALELVFRQVAGKYLFPGLPNLGIVLAVDVLTAVAIVAWASRAHLLSGEPGGPHLGFGEFKDINLRAPAVTSAYVLLLSSLAQAGLVWLAGQCAIHFMTGGFDYGSWVGFAGLFGFLFLGLLVKYEEWSGVWDMGVVCAVVEGGEKEGVVAIGVCASMSRACRGRGTVLAAVFLAGKVGLRVWGLRGTVAVTGVAVGLGCAANVIKWVVFVVYFWDCKKRSMEKKVDAEDGRALTPPPTATKSNIID